MLELPFKPLRTDERSEPVWGGVGAIEDLSCCCSRPNGGQFPLIITLLYDLPHLTQPHYRVEGSGCLVVSLRFHLECSMIITVFWRWPSDPPPLFSPPLLFFLIASTSSWFSLHRLSISNQEIEERRYSCTLCTRPLPGGKVRKTKGKGRRGEEEGKLAQRIQYPH